MAGLVFDHGDFGIHEFDRSDVNVSVEQIAEREAAVKGIDAKQIPARETGGIADLKAVQDGSGAGEQPNVNWADGGFAAGLRFDGRGDFGTKSVGINEERDDERRDDDECDDAAENPKPFAAGPRG